MAAGSIEEWEEKYLNAEVELEEARNEISEQNKELVELAKKLSKEEKERNGLSKRIGELDIQIRTLKGESESFRQRAEQFENEYERLRREMCAMEMANDQLKNRLRITEEQLADRTDELAMVNEERACLECDLESMDEFHKKLQKDMADLHKRYAALEEKTLKQTLATPSKERKPKGYLWGLVKHHVINMPINHKFKSLENGMRELVVERERRSTQGKRLREITQLLLQKNKEGEGEGEMEGEGGGGEGELRSFTITYSQNYSQIEEHTKTNMNDNHSHNDGSSSSSSSSLLSPSQKQTLQKPQHHTQTIVLVSPPHTPRSPRIQNLPPATLPPSHPHYYHSHSHQLAPSSSPSPHYSPLASPRLYKSFSAGEAPPHTPKTAVGSNNHSPYHPSGQPPPLTRGGSLKMVATLDRRQRKLMTERAKHLWHALAGSSKKKEAKTRAQKYWQRLRAGFISLLSQETQEKHKKRSVGGKIENLWDVLSFEVDPSQSALTQAAARAEKNGDRWLATILLLARAAKEQEQNNPHQTMPKSPSRSPYNPHQLRVGGTMPALSLELPGHSRGSESRPFTIAEEGRRRHSEGDVSAPPSPRASPSPSPRGGPISSPGFQKPPVPLFPLSPSPRSANNSNNTAMGRGSGSGSQLNHLNSNSNSSSSSSSSSSTNRRHSDTAVLHLNSNNRKTPKLSSNNNKLSSDNNKLSSNNSNNGDNNNNNNPNGDHKTKIFDINNSSTATATTTTTATTTATTTTLTTRTSTPRNEEGDKSKASDGLLITLPSLLSPSVSQSSNQEVTVLISPEPISYVYPAHSPSSIPDDNEGEFHYTSTTNTLLKPNTTLPAHTTIAATLTAIPTLNGSGMNMMDSPNTSIFTTANSTSTTGSSFFPLHSNNNNNNNSNYNSNNHMHHHHHDSNRHLVSRTNSNDNTSGDEGGSVVWRRDSTMAGLRSTVALLEGRIERAQLDLSLALSKVSELQELNDKYQAQLQLQQQQQQRPPPSPTAAAQPPALRPPTPSAQQKQQQQQQEQQQQKVEVAVNVTSLISVAAQPPPSTPTSLSTTTTAMVTVSNGMKNGIGHGMGTTNGMGGNGVMGNGNGNGVSLVGMGVGAGTKGGVVLEKGPNKGIGLVEPIPHTGTTLPLPASPFLLPHAPTTAMLSDQANFEATAHELSLRTEQELAACTTTARALQDTICLPNAQHQYRLNLLLDKKAALERRISTLKTLQLNPKSIAIGAPEALAAIATSIALDRAELVAQQVAEENKLLRQQITFLKEAQKEGRVPLLESQRSGLVQAYKQHQQHQQQQQQPPLLASQPLSRPAQLQQQSMPMSLLSIPTSIKSPTTTTSTSTSQPNGRGVPKQTGGGGGTQVSSSVASTGHRRKGSQKRLSDVSISLSGSLRSLGT